MPFHSIPLYPTFQSLLCRLCGSLCKYKQICLQFLISPSPFTQKVDYHIPDISISISMHREFPHLFLSCTVCQCVEYQHLFNYPNLMDLQVVSNLLLLQAMPRQLTLYRRTPLAHPWLYLSLCSWKRCLNWSPLNQVLFPLVRYGPWLLCYEPITLPWSLGEIYSTGQLEELVYCMYDSWNMMHPTLPFTISLNASRGNDLACPRWKL